MVDPNTGTKQKEKMIKDSMLWKDINDCKYPFEQMVLDFLCLVEPLIMLCAQVPDPW